MRKILILLFFLCFTFPFNSQAQDWGVKGIKDAPATGGPYNRQSNAWSEVTGGSGGYDTNTLIAGDISVIGVTVGNYSNGMTISNNTSIHTVLQTMMQKRIPPTYTNPTLTLAYSGSLNIEVGTALSPTLTPTYTIHDAGSVTNYLLFENGSSIYTNTGVAVYSVVAFTVAETTYAYYGRAYYEEGATKNDNFGDPDATGKITASYLNSSTRTYRGQRKYWYDTSLGSNSIINSTDIRNLSSSALNPVVGTTFEINIVAGTSEIVIAYPKTIQEIDSIKYVELGNAEVKDTFTETEISVEGVGGYLAIPYRVYIYRPSVSFGDSATYTVVF